MIPTQYWASNFIIEDDDIDYLTNLLLERETPLETEELARAVVEKHINQEVNELRERYKDARVYSPALAYQLGERLVFTEFDYETGVVVGLRPGNNPDYGAFGVIAVQFDDDDMNTAGKHREFAAELAAPHELSESIREDDVAGGMSDLNADEVMRLAGQTIAADLERQLRASKDLIYMARKWFPVDLLMDVNTGHLNLAEAVLDIAGGGPIRTEDIIKQIGGLGKAPLPLQVFSMNYALNQDDRFDEVGPTGEVLWHLRRLEPEEVQDPPALLRYSPIDYDRALLTPEMLALEAEIADEHSPGEVVMGDGDQMTITLTYPHRRLGTFPLSSRVISIFPTARQTPHVSFTLVDGQDGEEYPAWVVRKERYVFGLAKFYRKHKLPVGAYVTVRKGQRPGTVEVNFHAYKPRTEWIRLIIPKNDTLTFENQKRAIGAEYDEQMIMGADDLAGVDAVVQATVQHRKSLVAILRSIIPSLGALTPQGTVHAKTLYSAVNVLRRCPPGPIFAVLAANPDFQNVGGDYWKLTGD
jgi:hypothetical protein